MQGSLAVIVLICGAHTNAQDLLGHIQITLRCRSAQQTGQKNWDAFNAES